MKYEIKKETRKFDALHTDTVYCLYDPKTESYYNKGGWIVDFDTYEEAKAICDEENIK